MIQLSPTPGTWASRSPARLWNRVGFYCRFRNKASGASELEMDSGEETGPLHSILPQLQEPGQAALTVLFLPGSSLLCTLLPLNFNDTYECPALCSAPRRRTGNTC